jgi:hypothetical protein
MDVPKASPPPSSAQVQPYSDATYPQIVRISSAEGDVRVSRGTRRATWETVEGVEDPTVAEDPATVSQEQFQHGSLKLTIRRRGN